MATYLLTYKNDGEPQRRTVQVEDDLRPAAAVAESFSRFNAATVYRCQAIGHSGQVLAEHNRLWERKKAAVG
jgi:hypothetical protein